MANDVLGNMHGIMQQAFDRSNQRQAAMMGLNNAIAPAPTIPASPPPTPVERSPSVNPMFVPGAGGYQGGPVSPGLGGVNPADPPRGHAPSPGLGGGSMQGFMQPIGGDFGGTGRTPITGTPNSMNQSGPVPPINGMLAPGTNPRGGIPSPGLGGAVGQTSGLGMPNSMNQTGPNQASGTPMPPPGTAGAPTPSPGLGGVVGQGPAQMPAPSLPTSTPAGTPQGSGSPAIPNPRAGMPTPPATSAPSQPRSMPAPPWAYQQQNIQIPGNILAGNPNLANLAPGGQVDVSGAMGPIWGPINKGQLPGGLAGQMFQGTIDPRTGQPLGQGGGPVGQPAGAPGINASLVPGVGGAVPSPGLGGVPAGVSGQPGIPSTTSPGLGGVPAVSTPSIPNLGLAGQIINSVNGGVNNNVLSGAGPGPGVAPAPPGAAPAPSGPGAVPGVQAPGALPGGVRSAREILASRLGGANAPVTTPGVAAPAASAPTTGAAPVPPGGAPAPSAAPVQPGTSGGVFDPQGTVQGAPQGNGTPWANINQYDDAFAKYGAMYGVDPMALKAVMAVESGGVVPGNGHGLMQVQDNWQGTGGYDINTNDGQIAVAAMILGGAPGTGGTPGDLEGNFRSLYFNAPVDTSGNGTTQDAYWNWIQSNLGQGGTAPAGGPLDKTGIPGTAPAAAPANGTTPFPTIQATPTQAQNGKMITSNPDYSWANSVTPNPGQIGYGFDDASQCPGCYNNYQQSEWGDPNAHPGVDIPVPRGSSITAPISGTITCDHTYGAQGAPDAGDGTGCNAFGDTGGGAGQLTEQLGNGDLIIFGHASASNVQIGQQVQAGQQLGLSGTENGDHIHLEVRHKDPATGQWTIVDPTLYFSGYYGPVY